MKKWKILCALLLAVFLSTGALLPSALAADAPEPSETVTDFSDGSYLVTRITYDAMDPAREAGQKSGTKSHDYYNSAHQILWTFRVHGTFSYDGGSAEATGADYSYDIYDSAWSFNSGSAFYSGAKATASGSFTILSMPSSLSVSLTCSGKGVLS